MNVENDSDFFLPKPKPKQGKEAFELWLEKFNTIKSMKHLSLEDLIGKWKSAKKMHKDLEIELNLLKDAVILRSQDQPLDKYGLLVEKVKRKGSINWKSIPEINDIDLEKYRDDEIEYWKISEIENDTKN